MVSDWIAELVNSEPYTTEMDVLDAVVNKQAQMWIAWGENVARAVCITQLEEHPKAKCCFLWLMAGRGLNDWKHLITGIEAWAKREGCKVIRSEVRPGLKKALAEFGFKSPRVILEKEI